LKLFLGSQLLALRVSATLAVWLLASVGPAAANGTHTGHQFSVTETGNATISIPIQVPRGIGGMEPQLTLNYSSGAGNGLLGTGWSLAGPSSVTRCAKTPQHDNGERGAVTYSDTDRFCLDGQRLLSSSPTNDSQYGAAGTVYWTERESFSRVTAVGAHSAGGPAGFKVETKAGLVLEFGAIPGVASSSDAQVMTNPVDASTPVVGQWMLKRISDRMRPNTAQPSATPNYVEFYYCRFPLAADMSCPTTGTYTGSVALQYIRYTNRGSTPNGTAAVLFGYEPRPDRLLKFHHGTSQVQTHRLAYITTFLGFSSPTSPGQRVKTYELTYEPLQDAALAWTRATHVSRLTRVQELVGTINPQATRPPPVRSETEALPPLQFTYASDSVYGKVVSQGSTPGATTPTPNLSCGGYVGTYRVALICP
jgi:hypothetical protein